MKQRLSKLSLLLVAGAAFAADYHHSASGKILPDPNETPGAVLPVTADDICVRGYSKKVRNVPVVVKKHTYKLYLTKPKAGICCEVDHLISLELGGSNNQANLWPQPWVEARQKDKVENYLHAAVCAGRMTLEDAQREIATDWSAILEQMQ